MVMSNVKLGVEVESKKWSRGHKHRSHTYTIKENQIPTGTDTINVYEVTTNFHNRRNYTWALSIDHQEPH